MYHSFKKHMYYSFKKHTIVLKSICIIVLIKHMCHQVIDALKTEKSDLIYVKFDGPGYQLRQGIPGKVPYDENFLRQENIPNNGILSARKMYTLFSY